MTLYTQPSNVSGTNRDWFSSITNTVVSANPDRIILLNTDGTHTYLWSALIFGNLSFNAGANTLTGTIQWMTRTETDGTELEAAGDTANNINLDASTFWNSGDRFNLLFGGDDTFIGYAYLGYDYTSFFDGGAGADTFRGGNGRDGVTYQFSAGPITVDLQDTSFNTQDAVGDVYNSIENVSGTLNGSNSLRGDGGDNELFGQDFDDILQGRDGADFLRGKWGDDALEGGAGADELVGDSGNDYLVGGLGNDIIHGTNLNEDLPLIGEQDFASWSDRSSGVSVTLLVSGRGTAIGAGGETDTLRRIYNLEGSFGADQLRVGSSADGNSHIFRGLSGNDELLGGNGSDTLDGGTGSDTINGGGGVDTAEFASVNAPVTVNLQTQTAVSGVDTDTVTGIENVTGSVYGNSITGDANNNILKGLDGADILTAVGGGDRLEGGEGDDILVAGGAFNELVGGNGTDTMSFAAAASSLNFFLNSAGGGSLIVGGWGQITYSSIDNVTGTNGFDQITGNGGANTLRGLDSQDRLSGSDGDDVLDGGADNDTLAGGAGEDFMDGNTGSDTADYSGGAAVAVSLLASGWQQTGGAGYDWLWDIENIVGSEDALNGDSLEGWFDANRLEGRAGNDILRGLGGIDTLLGGDGLDSLDGGDDGDTLDGGADGDFLEGGGGGDTYIGGAGNDVFQIAAGETAGDRYDGGADFDTLRFSTGGIYDLSAVQAYDIEVFDFDRGAAAAARHCVLDWANADSRVFRFDSIGASVLEYFYTGLANYMNLDSLAVENFGADDRIRITGGDFEEIVDGSDHAEYYAMGRGADDVLAGGGNDQIDGGQGADQMRGGLGNDTYFVNDGADQVIEAASEGYDTVNTQTDVYVLGANVERVNFDALNPTTAFTAIGNNLANRMQGAGGDDRFVDVLGGADIVSGGLGTDSMDFRTSTTGAVINLAAGAHGGAAAGDTYASIEKFFGSAAAGDTMTAGTGRADFSGFGGNDALTGGISVDKLSGGDGGDTLDGGANDDTLHGGRGNDTMKGGSGKDIFLFVETAASGGWGRDTIGDFSDGLDRIKIDSPGVAASIADFAITGNGTSSVLLALASAPANTIAINGVNGAAVTITAADFLFY